MGADSNDDLGWLAFRYISNEMTEVEMEAFEQRLSEDQAAREAVAQAVTWTEAVASDEPNVLQARRTVSVPRIRWFAAAAASIAACVMVFHSLRDSWQTKTLARAFAEHMGPDTFRVADPDLVADSDDAISADEDSDWTVPTWMMEAVVGSSDTN